VKETTMSEPDNDTLLSAGTPADTKGIQFLETIAIVSAPALITLLLLGRPYGWAVVAAGAAFPISLLFAYLLRYDRVLRNEQDARDAREVRYAFPPERGATLNTIDAPPDFRDAAMTLVGDGKWSHLEIVEKLSVRVGRTRANEYLPLVLQHADRTTAGAQGT
jgi:hypothetical protein